MAGGFTLGGKSASELGLRLLQKVERRILPDTRDLTLTIPGRPGAYDFGGEFGPRLFELGCIFLAVTSPNILQQRVRNLASHLVDAYGKPRSLQLSFDDEPDKYYTVRYSGSLPLEHLVVTAQFTLPLVAYNPFAYGAEQTYTFTITSSPTTMEITSSGSAPTYPIFKIKNIGQTAINGFSLRREVVVD